MQVNLFVIIFIAIWLVGWYFPDGGVEIDIVFGLFTGNGDALELWLWRYFVSECYTIIEYAKSDGKNTIGGFGFS